MATKNPVSWFEIPTQDIMRAKKFYEGTFGGTLSLSELGPVKMAMFNMANDGSGAGGALVNGKDYKPSHSGTRIYFSVNSIEDTLKKIETSGGKVTQPKTSIGEWGFIASFEDTEGNLISLHTAH